MSAAPLPPRAGRRAPVAEAAQIGHSVLEVSPAGETVPAGIRPAEVMLPVIVVTRLRLRDPALLDDFFTAAVAVLEQAKGSAGCLGTDALADADNVWWTVTAWQDRGPMRAFTGSEPHLSTMASIDDWCDEATFVDWEQSSPDLPDWQASYDRIVADGRVSSLAGASAANATRAFPAPVEPA